jgi:hypothetical protein
MPTQADWRAKLTNRTAALDAALLAGVPADIASELTKLHRLTKYWRYWTQSSAAVRTELEQEWASLGLG